MTAASPSSGGWRGVVRHVAFKALFRSLLVNMVAPAVIYRLAASHVASGSLAPLALSALPPILALGYSVLKLRAVDFLGLFALESVIVNIASLLLAHSEKGALIGRSLQNVPLALIFFGSLALRRPLVLYMARQFATGNDPASADSFDRLALKPLNLQVYRLMTWVWTAGLLIKSAGGVYLAVTLETKTYLIASPLWDLLSDALLVSWSLLYGKARLSVPSAVSAPSPDLDFAPLVKP